MRFGLLQHMIRRAPTDRRDPMRLFADRPHRDEAIDKLFGAQGGMAGFDRLGTLKGYPSVKSVPHLLQVAAGHGTLQPNPRMKTERPHCGQEMSKLLRPK